MYEKLHSLGGPDPNSRPPAQYRLGLFGLLGKGLEEFYVFLYIASSWSAQMCSGTPPLERVGWVGGPGVVSPPSFYHATVPLPGKEGGVV